MASGVPVVASTSGAIPEVAGPSATYVAPGDWVGPRRRLAERLARAAPHVVRDAERVRRLSTAAAADRLAGAYERLLAG